MRKTVALLIFAMLLLSGTSVVFAEVDDTPGNLGNDIGVRLLNPLGIDGGPSSLAEFLVQILDFVVAVGSVVVAFMMVYVGYLFVMARGNPGEISKARDAFVWTIVGALIVLGSKAIATGILATVEALSGN